MAKAKAKRQQSHVSIRQAQNDCSEGHEDSVNVSERVRDDWTAKHNVSSEQQESTLLLAHALSLLLFILS